MFLSSHDKRCDAGLPRLFHRFHEKIVSFLGTCCWSQVIASLKQQRRNSFCPGKESQIDIPTFIGGQALQFFIGNHDELAFSVFITTHHVVSIEVLVCFLGVVLARERLTVWSKHPQWLA